MITINPSPSFSKKNSTNFSHVFRILGIKRRRPQVQSDPVARYDGHQSDRLDAVGHGELVVFRIRREVLQIPGHGKRANGAAWNVKVFASPLGSSIRRRPSRYAGSVCRRVRAGVRASVVDDYSPKNVSVSGFSSQSYAVPAASSAKPKTKIPLEQRVRQTSQHTHSKTSEVFDRRHVVVLCGHVIQY